jgi:2-oxoglutarate ferredoxin oxidoreductase subunit beta
MVYVIEDNGCYGLTKGQFSPTADLGSALKTGVVNDLPPIDTCALAIELGASFVARSFSGDSKQLKAVLKAALSHRGTCSFVPFFEDVAVEYDPGTTTAVTLHDGSRLLLTKIADDYNPTDRLQALRLLHETSQRGEFATGILYVEPDKQDFIDLLGLTDEPLAFLDESRTRPGKAALDEIMESFR